MRSHRARARGLVVVVAILVAASLAAVPLAGAGVASGADATTLRWRSCGGGLECASLTVPGDDAQPAGPTVDLAIVREPARDPQHRIGSLVVNPGGPGASGVDFVRSSATGFPSDLRDRFDIVGFDPRGTGRSEPIHCVDDMAPYYALDFSPDDQAERDALVAGVQSFVDACVRNEGDRLAHVSTADTVRDLDRLRAALGDERLTFLGFSYGTYIGAKYAEAYPTHVRALVLDGAIDPSLDAEALGVQQAEGFEHVLDGFLRWCARHDTCAFHRSGESARAFDRLRARVDRDGLAVPGTQPARRLTPTEFELGLASAIYEGRASYSYLGNALDAADGGDGTSMAALADAYTERRSDGTYSGIEQAFLAIGCADGPPVADVADVEAIEAEAALVAPRLGPAIINNSLACAFWPVAAPPAAPVQAPDAPPILVIGTRDDPATPVAWAKALADQLESGVLVTAPGEQHTAFGRGNACVDGAVIQYLVGTKAPGSTLRCRR